MVCYIFKNMKSFFQTIAWIVLIPVFGVLVFSILGFMAIRFDFWPPTCGAIPIKEARRVCEFSKLEKTPAGQPAKITFWVTIPYNAPADKLLLSIDGKDQ